MNRNRKPIIADGDTGGRQGHLPMRPTENGPIAELNVPPGIKLYHTGPALDWGPLPTLFYFALSGPDSLATDPFNQPVQFLKNSMIRIFSLTLPGHENGLPPTKAIELWAEDFSKGRDPLKEFLSQSAQAVQFAIDQKLADPNKLAVAGLSRGGLIAFHLAAKIPQIRWILGFAPLTQLSAAKEFISLQNDPLVASYDAEKTAATLADRHIRLYIGNRDTRVGTRRCFHLLEALSEAAHEQRVRPPQIELFITASIGQYGHGTSLETFRQGADWISLCINK